MFSRGRDIAKRHALTKKRERRVKRRYFIVLGFFGLALFCTWLAESNQFLIKTYSITGNRIIASEKITSLVRPHLQGEYLNLVPKNNSLVFPRGLIKSEVTTKIPYIYDLDFNLQGLHHLEISVKEREPVALVCRKIDDCYFVDQAGFVFARSPKFSDNIFLKIYRDWPEGDLIGQKLITKADLAILPLAAEILPETLSQGGLEKVEVISVMIDENEDHFFTLTQPLTDKKLVWQILLDREESFEHTLSNLRAILASKEFGAHYDKAAGNLEYIDLRFGNKVFYKFKTDPVQTEIE